MISLESARLLSTHGKRNVDLGDIVYAWRGDQFAPRQSCPVLADCWRIAAKSLRPLPVAHKEMSEESRVRQLC